MLPRLPLLLGVIGLGAVVTTGTLSKRKADAQVQVEVEAIRTDVAARQAELAHHSGRFANLRWHAGKMHAAVETTGPELEKAWARERARRFDALVARIDARADEQAFGRLAGEIEALCRRGDLASARDRLLQLPVVRFPGAAEFQQLRHETYLRPLAEFSRQNPAYYRAFQMNEPEAAKEDLAQLRAELAAAGTEEITPHLMVKLELVSAVALPGDPLVAEWNALATAADYFENPDASTLAQWRAAQKAIRLEEWPTAVARMQSILRTTVRTRQPYRAAYGWALLKNRPDQTAAAYPYLEEAAATGDSKARAWVVQEDLAQGRPAQAVRWLETAVMQGEAESVPKLLEIYAMKGDVVPRDVGREVGMLRRIIVAPDAPPLASLLLARRYEEGAGVEASAATAFGLYRRAAAQNLPRALADVARCYARGIGTGADAGLAGDWACRAFRAGERERSVALLMELLQSHPDRVATSVQEMFEQEQVAAPSGFLDLRSYGPGVRQLQVQLARTLDQQGNFSGAARWYGQADRNDSAVAHRHAELTAARPCETCEGVGKIKTFAPCPTCAGKGTVLCALCDGRGYRFIPGTPPCTACGGSGATVQEGRSMACAACGGTGKGKGSVVKQTCAACVQGQALCRDCTGGRILITKECPDCRGAGTRALADRRSG